MDPFIWRNKLIHHLLEPFPVSLLCWSVKAIGISVTETEVF